MTYFDDDAWERDKDTLQLKSFKEYLNAKDEKDPGHPYQFVPHVIEPSAGADRATLAFLCQAYDEDQAPDERGAMQTRVVMRLHPRLAPDQGSRVAPGQKGWHAGNRPGHLRESEKIHARLL